MIQRKQTLFLLAALVASIVCLCYPVGGFEPKGMGVGPVLFNIGLRDANGVFDFGNCALFALLVVTCPISIAAIFLYHKRKLQAKLCWWNVALDVAWYAYLGYYVLYGNTLTDVSFHPAIGLCLPLIAIIFYVMAHRGIMHDEKLVRAADRIR